MKLNSMSPAAGSKRPRLRVGRGASAGQGKTCGRGVKGQRARIMRSGEIKVAVTIRGVGVTKGAREAIEAAGGKVEAA